MVSWYIVSRSEPPDDNGDVDEGVALLRKSNGELAELKVTSTLHSHCCKIMRTYISLSLIANRMLSLPKLSPSPLNNSHIKSPPDLLLKGLIYTNFKVSSSPRSGSTVLSMKPLDVCNIEQKLSAFFSQKKWIAPLSSWGWRSDVNISPEN